MAWIIGYGSLIWRPAFPSVEAVPGVLHGWTRRFWQGSPDHRGTPEAPGRVVTVLPLEPRERLERAERIGVVAYRLDPADEPSIRARLDHREKAGYALATVQVALDDGREVLGDLYTAGPDNDSWLGPAPVREMAEQIARSVGPSGRNIDYLTQLDDALERMGRIDPHVRGLRRAVEALHSDG